jgi:hypothetical protein
MKPSTRKGLNGVALADADDSTLSGLMKCCWTMTQGTHASRANLWLRGGLEPFGKRRKEFGAAQSPQGRAGASKSIPLGFRRDSTSENCGWSSTPARSDGITSARKPPHLFSWNSFDFSSIPLFSASPSFSACLVAHLRTSSVVFPIVSARSAKCSRDVRDRISM